MPRLKLNPKLLHLQTIIMLMAVSISRLADDASPSRIFLIQINRLALLTCRHVGRNLLDRENL